MSFTDVLNCDISRIYSLKGVSVLFIEMINLSTVYISFNLHVGVIRTIPEIRALVGSREQWSLSS